MSLIIKQYIEQLKSFESSIAIFDAEIEKIYDTFDCQLHTITGIGKTLAAVIFSEIGGKKFDSVPKLVAFAGLYPKNRQRAFVREFDNLPKVPTKLRQMYPKTVFHTQEKFGLKER